MTTTVQGLIDLAEKIEVRRRLRGPDSIIVTVDERRAYGAELTEGRLLYLPLVDFDAPLAFLIEQIERTETATGRQLVISGRTLDGIALGGRLAWPDPANYPADAAGYDEQTAVPAETALKHYADVNAGPSAVAERQVPGFAIATDAARGADVTVAARYQPVLDIALEIAYAADVGWKVTFDPATGEHELELIEPVDRSASVFFDFEFDALKAWQETTSLVDSRTLAVVAGQGEGTDRDIVIRPATEPEGLDRREAFIDARDIAQGETALLEARGDALLASAQATTSLTATPREFGPFVYTQDWHLGDRVLLRNARRGLEYAAQIVEVHITVTESAGVPLVEAVLDRPEPTLKSRVQGGAFTGGAIDQGGGGGGSFGEQGTWTPTPTFATPGTASWTPNTDSTLCRYTRMGNHVWLTGQIFGSINKGTASSYFKVTGAPYTPIGNWYGAGALQLDSPAIVVPTDTANLTSYIADDGAIYLWWVKPGADQNGEILASDFAAGANDLWVAFALHYETADAFSGGGSNGATVITDHGLLAGLGDNDHPQYPVVYAQGADPGAVGAHAIWHDTDDDKVYIRDEADAAWIELTGGGGAIDYAEDADISTQAFGDAPAAGASTSEVAGANHKHGMPALGTTTQAIGTAAGGAATTPSKSDHVHATGAGTPSTQAFGDAASTGTGPAAAMTDHKHAMPANPVTADAELNAIAGLTSAADKVPYFTGSGTAALADLTTAGRALIDDASASAQRTTLGVGTADSPEFAGVNVGHASDTTITRVSAGNLAVEGNALYRAGGTDVPVADGGTGASDAATARVNLGIQRIRETSTGALAAGASVNITCTWPTAWGDANYTVALAVMQSGNTAPPTYKLISKASASCVVRVTNNHSASQTYLIDCIGIDD